jgi:predicted O-methyltransferase YrrM
LSVKTFETDGTEALNCDITHGAFANPMLKAVLKKFGKRAFARSSACMEFEAFLKRINAGGKTCLEIGTYNGITAVVLSQFFENVICVSVDAEDLKRHIIKRDIVEFLGIKNITFHDCLDNKEKAHIIEGLDFDFAFSDGDHTHDTYSDFELVKRCGRVLFHEYWPIQAAVFNAVNALPQDEIIRADYDCFAFWCRKDLQNEAKRG